MKATMWKASDSKHTLIEKDLSEEIRRGIGAAQDYLMQIQAEDGHWCGELQGDTILESEYVLVMHYLGCSNEAKARKAGNYLRAQQRPEGGGAIYPGGGADLSASVKAYFVLKLLGDRADEPHMRRARELIL